MEFKKLHDVSAIRDVIEFHNKMSYYLTIDVETTGLNSHRDTVTQIVMSGKRKDSAVMFDATFVHELNRLNRRLVLIFQNFKFDLRMLLKVGVDLSRYKIRDTMLLHHLYDENAESHSLDAMVQEFYKDSYKEQFWKKNLKFEYASEEDQLKYACKDVIYTEKLYFNLVTLLTADEVPKSLIDHVHALAIQLYHTEIQGVAIDKEYLLETGQGLMHKISTMRKDLRQHVLKEVEWIEVKMWNREMQKRKTPRGKARVPKPEFSFDSSKQVCELLYQGLKLPLLKGKTGTPTVDDAALEKMLDRHPVVPVLQEYRGYQKVYTSFIEGTLERMHNGRIYPSFNVNGTVTGRISSSNPNMQQLPKEGGIRGIYVPDPGYKFVTCDYAQLEVTLAAHFSRDRFLLQIVNDNASQHDITAQQLKIPRDKAKTLNFAMQYLCTPYRVAKILGVSLDEAELVWNKYWETYSGLKALIDECDDRVENGLPIISPFGRRRRFPLEFENAKERAHARRQAFNSLIQGTGADLTHRAFYLTAEKMQEKELGRAMFEVHDELVIMPRNNYCKESSELLQSIMVNVGREIELTVPLRVDCSEPLDRWEK